MSCWCCGRPSMARIAYTWWSRSAARSWPGCALDPRIPRDLETILMKAIEKDPRQRYPSANDLAEDLRRYLADEPIRARRIGPLERHGLTNRDSRGHAALIRFSKRGNHDRTHRRTAAGTERSRA